jgi:hypothetical protein
VLTGRAEAGSSLRIVAGAPVKKGAQILIAYGLPATGQHRFIQVRPPASCFFFLAPPPPRGKGTRARARDGGGWVPDPRANAAVALALRPGGGGSRGGLALSESERLETLARLAETTVEEDERLLEEGGMDEGEELAVRFRVGIKRALLDAA